MSVSSVRADDIDSAILLLGSPLPNLRAQTALALGTRKEHVQRVLPALKKALSDRHPTVRVAASLALGRLGAIEAVDDLVGAVRGEDRIVADAARRSLDKIISGFVSDPERSAGRRFALDVRGAGDADVMLLRRFTALASESLLGRDGIDVGESHDFDDAAPRKNGARPVALALRGEVMTLSTARTVLRLELTISALGLVLKEWRVVGSSKATADDALAQAVRSGVGQVVAFLGVRGKAP